MDITSKVEEIILKGTGEIGVLIVTTVGQIAKSNHRFTVYRDHDLGPVLQAVKDDFDKRGMPWISEADEDKIQTALKLIRGVA